MINQIASKFVLLAFKNYQTTIFAKIINKQIPAKIVFEDDYCLAFHDVAPKAETHILIIPKEPIDRISNAKQEHQDLLGRLLLTATQIGRDQKLKGYRLVINDGKEGGQTVFHLHIHLLGGPSLPGFE